MAQIEANSSTITGYFEDQSDAQDAVQALQGAGFTSAHLGVAHRGGYGSGSETTSGTADSTSHQKGAGVWDKVKNFFEGSPEAYADERREGDLGTREITDSNTSSAYGAYDNDNFHQNLSGLNVPEDRSRYMAHRFGSSQQGAIVTVNAGSRNAQAEEILRRYGADLGENASGYDYSSGAANTSGEVQDRQNVQLLGEILRVQKERVSRGDVTIRKEVVTENQTVQVPVAREELVIERRAADGNTSASGTVGQSSEIRIPLTEERASVDKSTVVREEVSVGKKTVSGVRDLSSDVRHEELVIDDNTKKAVNS